MAGYPSNPRGNYPAPAGWTGSQADPCAPDGGNGPGHQHPYSRRDVESESWFWGAVHGAEHLAAEAYQEGVQIVHDVEDTAVRITHVAQAIYIANDYADAAITAKIRMDVEELKKAFIPGLLMSLGILAVTTFIGAAGAGILAGILSGGTLGVPAAIAGGEFGLDAGFLILDALGILFLVKEIFESVPKILTLVEASVRLAWNAGADPKRPPITDIDKAAHGLANASAELVNVVIEGVLIWVLSKSAIAKGGKLAKGAGNLRDPAVMAARGREIIQELKAKPAEMEAALAAATAELSAMLRKAGSLTRGLADFVEKKFSQILHNVTEDATRKVEDLKGDGGAGDTTTQSSSSTTAKSNKKAPEQIPHARRNGRLAGQQHPKTGVPFNEKGYPVFDSAYDVDLPDDLQGPDVSDNTQFKYATKQLKQEIADNPGMADQFTPEQLQEINDESPKIDDYTWHHSENGVTLQLVDQDTHALTGHDGGRSLTGGRP